MKCGYTSLLSLFIDKELDEERTKILREHLKSCRTCKEELQTQMKIKAVFTPKLNYTLSPDFTDKIIASLPEKNVSFAERFSIWIDNISLIAKRLVLVPLVLATLLVLFIAIQHKTILPMSIEDVLLGNHFSPEEALILSDSQLSSEVALELLME